MDGNFDLCIIRLLCRKILQEEAGEAQPLEYRNISELIGKLYKLERNADDDGNQCNPVQNSYIERLHRYEHVDNEANQHRKEYERAATPVMQPGMPLYIFNRQWTAVLKGIDHFVLGAVILEQPFDHRGHGYHIYIAKEENQLEQ